MKRRTQPRITNIRTPSAEDCYTVYSASVQFPDDPTNYRHRVETGRDGNGLWVKPWQDPVLSDTEYGARDRSQFLWLIREAIRKHPEAFR